MFNKPISGMGKIEFLDLSALLDRAEQMKKISLRSNIVLVEITRAE
jgi:hypothetical protein